MPKISKRTQANREIYEALKAKTHAPAEAIAALRGYKQPKFDQSVDVAVRLGVGDARRRCHRHVVLQLLAVPELRRKSEVPDWRSEHVRGARHGHF